MDQKKMFKQMLDFQKKAFDSSFEAMSLLQEQSERMVNVFLEQAAWLPEDGKKAVNTWIGAYKEGRDNFREATDKNFEKIEDYFNKA